MPKVRPLTEMSIPIALDINIIFLDAVKPSTVAKNARAKLGVWVTAIGAAQGKESKDRCPKIWIKKMKTVVVLTMEIITPEMFQVS